MFIHMNIPPKLQLAKRQLKESLAIYLGLTNLYQTPSFAQEGEDIIIGKLLEEIKNGFYIDIGAHHPYRFSNTYLLYQRGWSGINIDPMPGSMRAFAKTRPRDINLEIAVSNENDTLKYYQFSDSALNTFDQSIARRVIQSKQSQLISKKNSTTQTLASVAKQFLPKHTKVSFLNIDVEGLELAVLQTNDWKRVAPKVLAVEHLSMEGIEKVLHSDIAKFLSKKGYSLQARTVNTLIFVSTIS